VAAEHGTAEGEGLGPQRRRQFVDKAFGGEGGQRRAAAAIIAAVDREVRGNRVDPQRGNAIGRGRAVEVEIALVPLPS